MRNFGMVSGRPRVGANLQPSASRAKPTLRDFNIPDSILSSNTPFPSPDLKQAMLDVGAVCFAFLFVTIAGISIALGAFILLFCEIH